MSEPTYGEVKDLAGKLLADLAKRVKAREDLDDLTPEKQFVAVMIELDALHKDGVPEEVTVSRRQYGVMQALMIDIMLDDARDVLQQQPPSDMKH